MKINKGNQTTKYTHRDDKEGAEGAAAAGPEEEVADGDSGSFPKAGSGLSGGGSEPLRKGRRRGRGDAGDKVADDGVERLAAARSDGIELDLDRTSDAAPSVAGTAVGPLIYAL